MIGKKITKAHIEQNGWADYTALAEWCNGNGYHIEDKGDYFTAEKNTKSEVDSLTEEMVEIESWFEDYDSQVKQYQRCERLGLEYDKDMKLLDYKAVIRAKRLKEIKAKLEA